jgi:hypothetical protein
VGGGAVDHGDVGIGDEGGGEAIAVRRRHGRDPQITPASSVYWGRTTRAEKGNIAPASTNFTAP